MATITYGTSVNPIAKSNAAIRRKQRRKAEAIERELIESVVLKALGQKPEKREVLTRIRPTTPPDLKPLQDYQQQIEQAATAHGCSNHRKLYRGVVEGSCCLTEVALYAAGHRKSKNVTAR
ncbi:TPA: antitermination protein [Serratia marcescens]